MKLKRETKFSLSEFILTRLALCQRFQVFLCQTLMSPFTILLSRYWKMVPEGVQAQLHNITEHLTRRMTVRRMFVFSFAAALFTSGFLLFKLNWIHNGIRENSKGKGDIPDHCTRFILREKEINHFMGFSFNNSNTKPKARLIPKILHQTYVNSSLRVEYMPLVTDCRLLNPDWQYFLWRDEDNLAFVEEKFPQYLKRFKEYKIELQRADMIRYMVLYHYGGIYIDMDVECLRPFLPQLAFIDNAAFLDQEPIEHANILYGRERTAMNSAMGAVPKHPFFLEVLRTINSLDEDVPAPGWSTGPELLTQVYNAWMLSPNGVKYPVHILPSEVFSPLVDVKSHNFIDICAKKKLDHLLTSEQVKWFKHGCRHILSNDWTHDKTSPKTVARHKFMHMGYAWNRHKKSYYCDLIDVHVNVIWYTKLNRTTSV